MANCQAVMPSLTVLFTCMDLAAALHNALPSRRVGMRTFPSVLCSWDRTVTVICMISVERLEAICRFHELLRVAVAESTAPLPQIERQVVVDMMGELIAHAKETVEV